MQRSRNFSTKKMCIICAIKTSFEAIASQTRLNLSWVIMYDSTIAWIYKCLPAHSHYRRLAELIFTDWYHNRAYFRHSPITTVSKIKLVIEFPVSNKTDAVFLISKVNRVIKFRNPDKSIATISRSNMSVYPQKMYFGSWPGWLEPETGLSRRVSKLLNRSETE